MPDGFFDEPEDQSLVKAEIVVDYFLAWSKIMAQRADTIAYLDFYAGPGRYGSGEKSTPLLILERAIAEPQLRDRLITIFNDAKTSYTNSLADEFRKLPGIDSLHHQPQIRTGPVDDELVTQFEKVAIVPALSFIDPWAYKGLSLRLIRAVVKDWGCEAIFFFNYNRINMGVGNPLVESHMEALLGEERLDQLQGDLEGARPADREHLLRKALGEALSEFGAKYLIPFRFLRGNERPSHYICFVTKNPLGYSIMKEIMARKGVVDSNGVPRFEYIPELPGRQLRFDEDRPLLSLPNDLQRNFARQTLTVQEIYDRHNVGTPFIRPNYRKVLLHVH